MLVSGSFAKRRALLARALALAVAVEGMALGGMAQAQQMFVYPSAGQSPEQTSQDRYECHLWAVQQTGFDPTTAAPPAASSSQQQGADGSILRGAARGAAVGAVTGEIVSDDAGKGAAAGAAGGALLGAFKRHDNLRQQQAAASAPSQASQQYAAAQDAYNRALGACLQGRGYTVN